MIINLALIATEIERFNFPTNKASYSFFIVDHHRTTTQEVSDHEHIAILTFWISQYILCSSSIQVAKKFIGMATQIHEGRHLCLSKLILGTLYDSLGYASGVMQTSVDGKGIAASGPMWLFKFWLIATFKPKIWFFVPSIHDEEVANQQIEGIQLAYLTRRQINLSIDDVFS